MKTTKQQFETFQKYIYYWQKELGLIDWHIYVFHKKIGDRFADTASSCEGRGATVRFNTSWDDRAPTDKELRECALHEVLHILTAPLLNEARSRFADEYTMDAAEHSIVTRLTNLLVEQERK